MMFSTVLFVASFALTRAVDWDVQTDLDRYVHAADPSYSYTELNDWAGTGCHMYVLNMTSQTWLGAEFVEEPVWWHYLSIAIPTTVRYRDAAYLRIHGGDTDEIDPPGPGDSWNQRICTWAANTGSVGAYLRQVPNQPVFFIEEPPIIPRVEDFIIGYTWREFIEDPNEPVADQIALFPMVKAAKQAVDTMVTFAQEKEPSIQITKVLPSGASKRGWTAWLLGCTDQRVFAMAPIVFDLLNFIPNLDHHFQSLGGWSWAFFPYWSEDVSKYLRHPRAEQIGQHIDPIEFNERLNIPKLIAVATGDQFFMPTGSQFFFDVLNGSNYMMVMENTDHGHGLHANRLFDNIQAFFVAELEQSYQTPTLSWTRTETATDGTLRLTTDTTPTLIQAWWADTTNFTEGRRDFRMDSLEGENNITWVTTPVTDEGSNVYSVTFDKPAEGTFRGFFIEARYTGYEGTELHFTSEMQVIPDTFPFPACVTEEECYGDLV